jgi:hypothetical protein
MQLELGCEGRDTSLSAKTVTAITENATTFTSSLGMLAE